LDYSNINGYWNSVVDSPGLQNRDLGGSLDKRYFAPSADDWRDLYRTSQEEAEMGFSPENAVTIREDMTRSLLWETERGCDFQGESYEHGFGAYIEGNIDATFHYGFSLIATVEDGFEVHQANGMIQIGGQTDLNYVIGGIGEVDIDKANQGNPAIFAEEPHELDGHVVTAGAASLTITPYYQFRWQFATFGDLSGGTGTENSTATFNGMGNTRIISDLGHITANFPVKDQDVGSQNDNRDKNRISIDRDDNFIYSTNDEGSRIAVGTYVVLGLKVSLDLQDRGGSRTIDLPDMSLNWNTMTEFSFIPGDDGEVCTEYSVG
jgi:chitinase